MSMGPTTFKRSAEQVLRDFLPGKAFLHPNDTVVRVTTVSGHRADGVNKTLVLEALDEQLASWRADDGGQGGTQQRHADFTVPASAYADDYALVEPEGMFYVTWPLVMRCTNRDCERVHRYEDQDAWIKVSKKTDPAKCTKCRSRLRQFDYMMVHQCGQTRELSVPGCKVKDGSGKEHGYGHIYLYDTRSFVSSHWRCRHGACGRSPMGERVEAMRQFGCGCKMTPRNFRYVTMRQDIRFISHTLKLVSFDEAPMQSLASPSAAAVISGSYLGLFRENWRDALDDAGKDRSDETEMVDHMVQLMRAAGDSEAKIDAYKAQLLTRTGKQFDDLNRLLDPAVQLWAGTDRRERERTLIWAGHEVDVWRMERFRQVAEADNRPGAMQLVDHNEAQLHQAGFSDLLVVDDFPVALAAYGYSRVGRRPSNSMLRAYNRLKTGPLKQRDKIPLYARRNTTEALFFELDAERVIGWLHVNDWLGADLPDLPPRDTPDVRNRDAKAFVLTRQAQDPTVHERCAKLVHTAAHALIKSLGERSGFGEDTMSEYLMPRTLTFGLFVDVHQQLSLGALLALAEHRLGDWLNVAVDEHESGTCEWDPYCGEHDGACMACLHLAFGCEHHNDGLDRAVLFGSPARGAEQLHVAAGYWGQLPELP